MKRFMALTSILLSLHLFSAYAFKQTAGVNTVIISGVTENGVTGDTVLITTYPYGIDYKFLNNTYYVILRGKSFRQVFSGVTQPLYVSLVFKKARDQDWAEFKNSNLYNYLIEPGDYIHIVRLKGRFFFRGKGAPKFELQNKLDSIVSSRQNRLLKVISPELMQYEYACDTITKIGLNYLTRYKNKLSKQACQLFYCNLLALGAIRKMNFILEGPDQISRALYYLKTCESIFSREERKLADYPDRIVLYSNYFQDFIIKLWQVDYFRQFGRKPGLADLFSHIQGKYKGVIREKLLCALLLKNRKNTTDLGTCIEKAAPYMFTAYFKVLLNSLRFSRLPGVPAIDFELIDSSGERYCLKNFAGRVLVIDFWFTGCSNCIRLNPFLTALEHRIEKEKVAFLTVSADSKKETWVNSLRSGLYTTAYSLNLIENNPIGSSSVFKNYNIDNFPTLLVIDKSGKLMRNVIDPRVDKGKDLIDLIHEGLQENHASAD